MYIISKRPSFLSLYRCEFAKAYTQINTSNITILQRSKFVDKPPPHKHQVELTGSISSAPLDKHAPIFCPSMSNLKMRRRCNKERREGTSQLNIVNNIVTYWLRWKDRMNGLKWILCQQMFLVHHAPLSSHPYVGRA